MNYKKGIFLLGLGLSLLVGKNANAQLSASGNLISNVSCNGGTNGSASAVLSGGTSPFTYSWAPSGGSGDTATGLSAGTYTVTVEDNVSLTATATVLVNQPNAVSVLANTVSDVTCNGASNGVAAASISDGTSPYTYAWTGGTTTSTASGLSAGTYTVKVTDSCGGTASAAVTITQPLFSVSASAVTNILCNGGSTGVTAASITGGTSPFAYSWTGGVTTDTASGLSAGTYTVTVTDSCGGTATASATINQPNHVSVTTGILTHITCNGASTGVASATASAGTSPYTYLWTGGATTADASGLSAGTYTVTVTDSCGGSASATANVTQPAALSASTSVANVTCNGGTNGMASAVLTGGTSPFTYAWVNAVTTDTVSGLSAGSYSVSVTDACGATATASATITDPAVLSIAPFTMANVSCNGGSTGSAATGIAGGGAPFTYSWTSGATTDIASGLSAGSYTVTVQDACGGSLTGSVTISQPNAISFSANVTANVTCNGFSTGSASTTLSGGTSPYVYSWTNGGTKDTATGLSAGNYTVTITDSCGGSASASINISQPNALAITASISSNVTCNGGSNGSTASNVTGGTSPYTYAWTPSGGSNSSANGLTAGVYTVTVQDNCGASASARATVTQPGVLTLSASPSSEVSCNGGSNGIALANVNGGTLPYTYTWNNGETTATDNTLTAGTYTVTVKDNCGASLTAVTTITQPGVLSISASVVANVSCHSGSTGKTASTTVGGTSPFVYLWSPVGGSNTTASGLSAGSYTVSVQDNCGNSATASVALTQPNALAVAASTLSNVSCHGGNTGSASVAINGGTSSYQYAWAPAGGNAAVANGLTAGLYTVTVTDSCGATASAVTIVTQPGALTIAANVTANVNCNGSNTGSASSVASGGTTPYVYSWAPAGGNNAVAIGLTAGSYTVTATDACGAVTSATITITQPNPLAISATVTANNNCHGQYDGAISSTLAGGTAPYIYTWAPVGGNNASVSSMAAGSYTVTVYDACGASATASATVTEPAAINVSASTLTNVTCNGGNNGSTNLSASGGVAPYAYLWSNGATTINANGLTAGNYIVTVTDANGCTNTALAVVNQPSAINATARVQNATGNNGAIWLNVNGGTSPYMYMWSPNHETTDSIVGKSAGNYCCTITDNNGCMDSVCYTINSDLGVGNVSASTDRITVYPNPSNGQLNVVVDTKSTGSMQVEIFSMLGQQVYSASNVLNSTFNINLANQPNGVYLYRVISNDNGSLIGEGKVVLQK